MRKRPLVRFSRSPLFLQRRITISIILHISSGNTHALRGNAYAFICGESIPPIQTLNPNIPLFTTGWKTISLWSKKFCLEPATAVFHFRGKLEYSGFPSQLLVRKFCSRVAYGRVSIISLGSIPASGFPVTFLGLSKPDWMLLSPASFSLLRISGKSLSSIPRSCRFCLVVMSQLPFSP